MAKAKTAQKRTRKVKVVTEKEALKKAASISPEAVGEVVELKEEIGRGYPGRPWMRYKPMCLLPIGSFN